MSQLVRMSHRVHVLRQGKSTHDYVRVERAIDGADQIDGHVVAVGAQWVLLSVFTAGLPNGWVALRIRDITAVNLAPGGEFVRRGLEFQSLWPPEPPSGQLTLTGDVQALITSAVELFRLVTFYSERQDPYSCVIGRPLSWTADQSEWEEIGIDASWSQELSQWPPALITRVDLGGQYELALSRVADLRSD